MSDEDDDDDTEMSDFDDDGVEPQMPDLDDDDEDEADDSDSPRRSNHKMKASLSKKSRTTRAAPDITTAEEASPAPIPKASAKVKKKTPPMNGWKGGKAVTSREASTDG